MKYVLRALLALVVIGGIGLAGYAYLGDLNPVQNRVEQPVKLNAD